MLSCAKHHIHKMTKKGLVPLTACLAKGKTGLCKGGFPKGKQINSKVRVICAGNAKTFGLRVSGRRNALGSLLGIRKDGWLCGTAPGFAVCFRSNTNTMPNFRVPITSATHDDENCKMHCVSTAGALRRLCRIASRAGKQTTGCFASYTTNGRRSESTSCNSPLRA